MNSNISRALRLFIVSVSLGLLVTGAPYVQAQEKKEEKKDQPKISEGEQQAITKINQATGPEAKLKAAAEYIKKNGKSPMRPRVAGYVADEVSFVNDPAQRLNLINEYNKIFNGPGEADLVKPTQIEALSRQAKYEDVLNEGGKFLEKNPDDVIVNTLVAYAGASLVQKQPGNTAYVQKATSAGTKAVELMEGDKKPEKMDAKYWADFRNSWLPRLYQARGVTLYFSGDKPGAKENLEKAMGIDPYDANTLLMINNILNDEYQALAQKYQAERKSALMDQAVAKMDELIDILARATAIMEGDTKYGEMGKQVSEQLKQFYSFRHNNSTDGLKELIEKYKKK